MGHTIQLFKTPFKLASLYLLIFSSLVILGWMYQLEAIHLIWITVNPTTGICFASMSICVFLLSMEESRYWQNFLVQTSSLSLILIGFFKVLSFYTSYIFSWDWLLYHKEIFVDGIIYPFPRMAAMTAINFGICGAIILLVSKRKYPLAAQILSLVILSLGILATVGHLYGIGNIFSFKMAIPTALTFIVFSVCILVSTKYYGFTKVYFSDHLGSEIGKKLIPFATAIPVILGWGIIKYLPSENPDVQFAIGLLVVLNSIILVLLITKNSHELNRIDIIRKKSLQELALKSEQLSERILELVEKDKTIEKINDFLFLSDSIPQIIWTSKPDGNLDYYNKHWFEYTGMTLEETYGWGWKPVIHPEDLQACVDAWTASYTTGKLYEIEYRFKRASDGIYRWHLGRAHPMRNDKGEIIKWFGTCTDIEDLRQSKEETKSTRDKLRTVIQNAPIVLWALDKNGVYTLLEGKGLEFIDIKPGEFLNLNHFELFKDSPDLIENAKRALRGEEFSYLINYKNRYLDIHYSPIKNNLGEITGMVAVSFDDTKRRLAETTNQFKTRFLASMSHEIRTPLNAILGFANILRRDNIIPEKKEEYLNHIFNSGNLLLKLIGDILDLSKIEEGKLDIIYESFNFKEAIRSAISPYKFKANEKNLEFNLNVDERIPDYLIGDAHKISQVIVNLLGNAIKFTKRGFVEVNINQVSVLEGICILNVAVSDSGTGIPSDKQRLIFEPFTQADTNVSKEFGGSGLGLSIAKQLVQLMGDELKILSPSIQESSGDYGSSFYFDLALKVDEVNKCQILDKNQTIFKFKSSKRVLVVEDNEINQILAEAVLTPMGCEIEIANDGSEAVKLIENCDFDIILMDIHMPIMDGYEATKIIRKVYENNIPIIGLSANVYQDDIRNSLDAGMNEHVGKPYTEKQIFDVIEKWT